MPDTRIHIIASCTERKKLPVQDSLQMGSIRRAIEMQPEDDAPNLVAKAWLEALSIVEDKS